MATRSKKSLAKTKASPAFACLHTKQITVSIFIGEKREGEIYGCKCEQISGVACFTGVARSEM